MAKVVGDSLFHFLAAFGSEVGVDEAGDDVLPVASNFDDTSDMTLAPVSSENRFVTSTDWLGYNRFLEAVGDRRIRVTSEGTLSIWLLGNEGYVRVDDSGSLPGVPLERISHYLHQAGKRLSSRLVREFRRTLRKI